MQNKCKNGIDFDECDNITENEYCDNCNEARYDSHMQALSEGFVINIKERQLRAQKVK